VTVCAALGFREQFPDGDAGRVARRAARDPRSIADREPERINIYVTPGAHDTEGIRDIGIVRINPSGTRVLYSTYLGGLGEDDCNGIAMTPTGRVSVVGETTGDYPTTTGAAQPSYAGGQTDALVSTLDLIPHGVRALGRSTHSCRGPIVLNAIGMPRQADASFGLYASGGPPGASGWLVISSGVLAQAQNHAGVALWLDPLRRLKRVPGTLTADGYLEITVPDLVAGPVGTRRDVQFVAENTAACGGLGTRSASNALEITVQ